MNENLILVRLNNGIKYTREQVRRMFPSQVETVKRQIILEDKKILKSWLNGND